MKATDANPLHLARRKRALGVEMYPLALKRITDLQQTLVDILQRFEDNPGISDLDDEQTMHMRCTLGDVRKWRRLSWRAWS